MKQYLDLLQHILTHGEEHCNRTGVNSIRVFGYQTRFDLRQGFPLVTTKKCHFKSVVHELLWFLSGSSNIDYLKQHDVRIWNEWANEDGELGPIYGVLWRHWQGANGKRYDQITELLQQMRDKPNSRRHIITAWEPTLLPKEELSPQQNVQNKRQALAPCHCFIQFFIANNRLSCQLYQRSADAFLGVPFNIASYSLLTHMIAQVLQLEVGEFIHTFGDLHIYDNHIEQVKTQLQRNPKPLATLQLNPKITDLFAFQYEDITLQNYQHHPTLKGKVAV